MRLDNLRCDERASIALRALYRQYGYLPYKVNTFEEYDLYMRNRSYLASEQILTFPDAGGTLMALKPDITLSIVKNTKDEDAPLKVCYCESIYRVPRGADHFKEIMQTGVECIGTVDAGAMGEMLALACRSLEAISPDYVLDVSDMSVVSAILSEAQLSGALRTELVQLVSEKNLHGLAAACAAGGVDERAAQRLSSLITVYGPIGKTLERYAQMELPDACGEAIDGLRRVCGMLEDDMLQHINLDFSVVNDMSYYNGLIFSGFVAGIPSSVLSGGRYDLLMRRMGRKSDAIGFAVYLDQLERLEARDSAAQVDVLILTGEETDPAAAMRLAQAERAKGCSVRVQRAGGKAIGAGRIVDMT